MTDEKTEKSSGDRMRPGSVEPPSRAHQVGVTLGQFRVIALAIFLPFIMAVGPVAGYFIGGWIGERVGHAAWGALGGLALGAATSVHQTVLIIRRILRELN